MDDGTTLLATATPHPVASEFLQQAEYNRQRLLPQPSDSFYLPLSDLRMFLKRVEGGHFPSVLDFGCGGSPYRSLVKCEQYKRADYLSTGDLDYVIDEETCIVEEDAVFDAVLSTQVLEHVREPGRYLAEAFRLLKPGGTLILTTHGVFEDHGCPYDFHRWTADGLRNELETAGFILEEMCKLTTGPRAALFLMEGYRQHLQDVRTSLFGWAFLLLRKTFYRRTKRRNLWIDTQFPGNRVVLASEALHMLYICLGVIARRP